MKRVLLSVIALLTCAFSVNAQVKIETPHPDLDVKVKRCAYANGVVVIDMLITNYGVEEVINTGASDITMYDDEGNSYASDNSTIEVGFPNRGLYNNSNFTFPQDIPLKFRVQMSNISTNASKFSLLKIKMDSRSGAMNLSGGKQPLIIRNLEWAK